MTGRRKHLVAAVTSSVCALTWLANCVVDVVLRVPGALTQDALMTLVWTVSAVCWWIRWRQVRRADAP